MSDVSGQVTDYFTGRPVVGATILFGNYIATTDVNGNYFLVNLPIGTYTIKILHRDYETTFSSMNLTIDQAYTLKALRIKPIFRAL